MNFSQQKMTFDAESRATGALRPTSLLLMSGAKTFDNSHKGSTTVKKKRSRAAEAKVKRFFDLYETTGEILGEGSFGHVNTYCNVITRKEYAVKTIIKTESTSRHRVLKEIEIFHHCQGHDNILKMVEYFEEDDKFYLVFEKMEGGTLLDCILKRGHLSEREATRVVRDIASGLAFLHKKGIAHRDLKPENILCARTGQLTPVKISDFDLGSGIQIENGLCDPVTTPELLSPVGSADFMAPEVVDVWQYQALSYDKRCDLWSLGIIIYILLCGYRPFYAHCKRDCDFDAGGECDDCQELLFRCIQEGVYSFPDSDWSHISHDAKDLIRHLLVKNPHQRYTAEQVLVHPWLCREQTVTTPLATPYILSRNNTMRELSMFAETANAVNRLIQQHRCMNEISSAARTPVYANDSDAEDNDVVDNIFTVPTCLPGGASIPDSRGMSRETFQVREVVIDIEGGLDGGLGELSEEEEMEMRRMSQSEEDFYGGRFDDTIDQTAAMFSTLNTANPRCATRRQAFQTKNHSECSVDSGHVSINSSPPEY